MRRILVAALTFGVFTAALAGVGAQGSGSHAAVVVPKGAEEVWQLEGQRRAAQLAGDVKTLDALCADEMTYTHTTGDVDTKKSYLAALAAGRRYERLDLSEVVITRYDNAMVFVGVAHIQVKSSPAPIRFRARFTGIWAKQQDRWRFAAWHTTRLPD